MARKKSKGDAEAPYPPGWEPFLAAINADLDDDTARLVFADWLQENGDEDRAELIRIQCELYRVHPYYNGDSRAYRTLNDAQRKLADREDDLLSRNQDRWVKFLPRWAWRSLAFRRGFVFHVSATAQQWLKDGEGVRRQSATEQLIITHTNPRARNPWQELFASPSVVGLKDLSLPDIDTEGVRALTTSAALDSLVALDLGKIGKWAIRAEDVAALVTNSRLRNLRRLALSSNWLGNQVAPMLAASQHIHDLEELRLVCISLLADDFAPLIASRKVERLRVLDLQGNAIGNGGVRALVRSKLASLAELNLRYNDLTAESARLLSGWPGLRTVRILHLAGNRFGPDGVRELLASKHLTSVEELELPRRDIGRREEAQIEALPEFERIACAHFAS